METGQTWEGYIRWQIIPVRRSKIKLIKKWKRLLRQIEPDIYHEPCFYQPRSQGLYPGFKALRTRLRFAGICGVKVPYFSNCNILLARPIDFCNPKVPVACVSEPQTTHGPQGSSHPFPFKKFYVTHCFRLNEGVLYRCWPVADVLVLLTQKEEVTWN